MEAASRAIWGLIALVAFIHLAHGGPSQAKRWLGWVATGRDPRAPKE